MASFRKLASHIVRRWMQSLSANAMRTYFPYGFSTSPAEDSTLYETKPICVEALLLAGMFIWIIP